MQLPLFVPKSSWKPPSLGDLPDWKGAKRVAFDTETWDPNLRGMGPGLRRGDAFVAGWSFAIEDGPCHYLPVGHTQGENLPKKAVVGYLKDMAQRFDGMLVGCNLGYDLDYAEEEGIKFTDVRKFRDIQVADALIDELQDHYSMEHISARHGLPGKEEKLLKEAAATYFGKEGRDSPKKFIAKLPPEYAGLYAEQDTRLPLQVLRRQEKIIEDQELWEIFELESEVLPVCVALRRRGVRVDLRHLEQVERWSRNTEKLYLDIVKDKTGVAVPHGLCHMAEHIGPALRAAGYQVNRTLKKGKDSVDRHWLAANITKAETKEKDPTKWGVAMLISEARQARHVRERFVKEMRTHVTNGRIHCTFNQIRAQQDDTEGADEGEKGVRYGRFSSSNPNMQGQPGRHPVIGKLWRKCYIPEEGALWTANDYSQQEPRWAVHAAVVAGRHGLIRPFAYEAAVVMRDKYRNDPTTDNHQGMADMAGIERDHAKTIYLGLSYGMGGWKLCVSLGLPTAECVYHPVSKMKFYTDEPEAKELIQNGERIWPCAGREGQALLDRFNQKVPFLKATARVMTKRADKVGQIRTAGGRICHFPAKPEGGYDWTHKAFNRYVQGTSADQTKRALVELYKAGHYIQLQVHDEIDGSVARVEEAKAMAKIMCECMPCEVPAKVDIEYGPSWGEYQKAA